MASITVISLSSFVLIFVCSSLTVIKSEELPDSTSSKQEIDETEIEDENDDTVIVKSDEIDQDPEETRRIRRIKLEETIQDIRVNFLRRRSINLDSNAGLPGEHMRRGEGGAKNDLNTVENTDSIHDQDVNEELDSHATNSRHHNSNEDELHARIVEKEIRDHSLMGDAGKIPRYEDNERTERNAMDSKSIFLRKNSEEEKNQLHDKENQVQDNIPSVPPEIEREVLNNENNGEKINSVPVQDEVQRLDSDSDVRMSFDEISINSNEDLTKDMRMIEPKEHIEKNEVFQNIPEIEMINKIKENLEVRTDMENSREISSEILSDSKAMNMEESNLGLVKEVNVNNEQFMSDESSEDGSRGVIYNDKETNVRESFESGDTKPKNDQNKIHVQIFVHKPIKVEITVNQNDDVQNSVQELEKDDIRETRNNIDEFSVQDSVPELVNSDIGEIVNASENKNVLNSSHESVNYDITDDINEDNKRSDLNNNEQVKSDILELGNDDKESHYQSLVFEPVEDDMIETENDNERIDVKNSLHKPVNNHLKEYGSEFENDNLRISIHDDTLEIDDNHENTNLKYLVHEPESTELQRGLETVEKNSVDGPGKDETKMHNDIKKTVVKSSVTEPKKDSITITNDDYKEINITNLVTEMNNNEEKNYDNGETEIKNKKEQEEKEKTNHDNDVIYVHNLIDEPFELMNQDNEENEVQDRLVNDDQTVENYDKEETEVQNGFHKPVQDSIEMNDIIEGANVHKLVHGRLEEDTSGMNKETKTKNLVGDDRVNDIKFDENAKLDVKNHLENDLRDLLNDFDDTNIQYSDRDPVEDDTTDVLLENVDKETVVKESKHELSDNEFGENQNLKIWNDNEETPTHDVDHEFDDLDRFRNADELKTDKFEQNKETSLHSTDVEAEYKLNNIEMISSKTKIDENESILDKESELIVEFVQGDISNKDQGGQVESDVTRDIDSNSGIDIDNDSNNNKNDEDNDLKESKEYEDEDDDGDADDGDADDDVGDADDDDDADDDVGDAKDDGDADDDDGDADDEGNDADEEGSDTDDSLADTMDTDVHFLVGEQIVPDTLSKEELNKESIKLEENPSDKQQEGGAAVAVPDKEGVDQATVSPKSEESQPTSVAVSELEEGTSKVTPAASAESESTPVAATESEETTSEVTPAVASKSEEDISEVTPVASESKGHISKDTPAVVTSESEEDNSKVTSAASESVKSISEVNPVASSESDEGVSKEDAKIASIESKVPETQPATNETEISLDQAASESTKVPIVEDEILTKVDEAVESGLTTEKSESQSTENISASEIRSKDVDIKTNDEKKQTESMDKPSLKSPEDSEEDSEYTTKDQTGRKFPEDISDSGTDFFTIKPYLVIFEYVLGAADPWINMIIEQMPPVIQKIFLRAPFELSPSRAFLLFCSSSITFLSISSGLFLQSNKQKNVNSSRLNAIEELSAVQQSLLVSEQEKEALESELETVQTRLLEFENCSSLSRDEASSLGSKIEALEAERNSLQLTVSNQTDQLADLNLQIGSQSQLLKDQAEFNATLQEKMEAAMHQSSSLEAQLYELQSTLQLSQSSALEMQSQLQCMTEEISILQTSKDQLLMESEGWNEKVQELLDQVSRLGMQEKSYKEAIDLRDRELEGLRNCFKQLKTFEYDDVNCADESESNDETEESKHKRLQDKIAQRINSMINVAEVNARANLLEDEKNSLKQALSLEVEGRMELEEQLKKLREEMENLSQSRQQAEQQATTAAIKMEVLSNYFKEKERDLHKKLDEQEAREKASVDQFVNNDEKAKESERMVQFYKEQVEDLQKEIQKIEADYRKQVSFQEKKAHENWLSARQSEREAKESKTEAQMLRLKINELQNKLDSLPDENNPVHEASGLFPGVLNGAPPPMKMPFEDRPSSRPQFGEAFPPRPPFIGGPFLPMDRPLPPPLFPPPPHPMFDRRPINMKSPPPGIPFDKWFPPPPPPPPFPQRRSPYDNSPPRGRSPYHRGVSPTSYHSRDSPSYSDYRGRLSPSRDQQSPPPRRRSPPPFAPPGTLPPQSYRNRPPVDGASSDSRMNYDSQQQPLPPPGGRSSNNY